MKTLEEFHEKLDQENWDKTNERKITSLLSKLMDFYSKKNDSKNYRKAEIEYQSFHFSKSPEKRLSFRTAGKRKMEDGSDISFEWPDIRTFNEDDFLYLYDRFNDTKNIFAKTEYGLVLYYAKYNLDNKFTLELLISLKELNNIYISKTTQKIKPNPYIYQSYSILSNSLHIAHNRKNDKKIKQEYNNLINLIIQHQKSIKVNHNSIVRILINYTSFSIQYFNDFNDGNNIRSIIEKNKEAAGHFKNTNHYGIISLTDFSIKLSKKANIDTKYWIRLKAEIYEKLVDKSIKNNPIAVTSHIEKAMSLYKSINDNVKYEELQQKYQEFRTEYQLNNVSQEISINETQRILDHIKKDIETKNESDIIKTILVTPMLRSLSNIKNNSEELFKEVSLQNLLSTRILDKFGNTIAVYDKEEERKHLSLLRTYDIEFQYAIQTLIQYVVSAFKENKISSKGIIDFLNQTWLGEKATRRHQGENVCFSYLKMIEPGINSFFDELTKWQADSNYNPNFVVSTDSLVLKAEYLLREFCYFLEIPTFKPQPKNNKIILERNINDILSDKGIKEALSEDDYFFIKFVLIEKAGLNLRSKIAHGLLDDIEYDIQYPLLAIIIILKLSNYRFAKK